MAGFIVGILMSAALLPLLVGQLRHDNYDPCNFFIVEASLSGPNVLTGALRGENEIDYLIKLFNLKKNAEDVLSKILHDTAQDVAKKRGTLFCYQMAYVNIVFPDQFDKFFEETAYQALHSQ